MWFCDDASPIELRRRYDEDVCSHYIACSQRAWRFTREGYHSLLNVLWTLICPLAINRTRILSHIINVRFIYSHLAYFDGKCRKIYHTWIVWVFQLKGMSCWLVIIVSCISTSPERVQKDCLCLPCPEPSFLFAQMQIIVPSGCIWSQNSISCRTGKYWESNLKLGECYIFRWKNWELQYLEPQNSS